MCPPTVGVAVTFISTSHKAPPLPQVAAAAGCVATARKLLGEGRRNEVRKRRSGSGGGEKGGKKASHIARKDSEDVLS